MTERPRLRSAEHRLVVMEAQEMHAFADAACDQVAVAPREAR